MVVSNQHVVCIAIGPTEHEAVLVVYPHAVVSRPLSFQTFQPIAGRHTEISQIVGGIQEVELPNRHRPHSFGNGPGHLGIDAVKQVFCCSVTEAVDHDVIYRFNSTHVSNRRRVPAYDSTNHNATHILAKEEKHRVRRCAVAKR